MSSEKWLHILFKVSTILASPLPHINNKTVASIPGSLQHVTMVYQQGGSHLALLTIFLSKFPNEHVNNIPNSFLNQISWWSQTLTIPNPYHNLMKLPELDLDLWVDVSTLWGIGTSTGSQWATWKLLSGWLVDGQDILWVEAITIELVVMWLTQAGLHNACLKVYHNNSSIINSWKSRSRNPAHNNCLYRITSSLTAATLLITPTYIQYALNKADALS